MPDYSELALHADYGDNDEDLQTTEIYETISEDSDEIDHKYVKEVYMGGKYVELAHYASVKQVVIQNISDVWGVTFHSDATTGAVVPDNVAPGEHISINNPDVTAGLMLYAILEASEWHLAVIGRLA